MAFTDLYGDLQYPDPENPEPMLDPRSAAARRRARMLRGSVQPAGPVVPHPLAPADPYAADEADGQDYTVAAEEAARASVSPTDAEAVGPEAPNIEDILAAGDEDPEKAAAMRRAKMLMGGETPQGRQVGRIFVASSPFEMLSHYGRQALGARELAKADKTDGGAKRLRGAKAALGLPADQRAEALILSSDPELQKAGTALLGDRSKEADRNLRELLLERRLANMSERDKQLFENALARDKEKEALRAQRPKTPPHANYTVAIGPTGTAYRVDRSTGSVSRVDLPMGPPPGAGPGSPEAKAAEAQALDKLPSDVRTKYNIYEWQVSNFPDIIARVRSAPPGTFGPGTDMSEYVPGQPIAAAVRTWQANKRTPEQVAARRAVFADAYAKIKEMAGTALSKTEEARVMEFAPNGNDSPEAIAAKLQGAYEEAQKQRELVRKNYLPTFPEATAPGRTGAAGSAPAAAPAGELPQVSTPADYAALPSGTRYRDPSGTIRTKR